MNVQQFSKIPNVSELLGYKVVRTNNGNVVEVRVAENKESAERMKKRMQENDIFPIKGEKLSVEPVYKE